MPIPSRFFSEGRVNEAAVSDGNEAGEGNICLTPVIQHRCTEVSEQRVQKFPQRSGIGQRLVHKLASGNHE